MAPSPPPSDFVKDGRSLHNGGGLSKACFERLACKTHFSKKGEGGKGSLLVLR